MNEEMRKEFEEFWVNYCEKRGVNCNLARLINDEYASWPEHNAYVGWQASREAMKPITLPNEIEIDLIGDMVANSHQNSYSEGYNDALKDVETAINEAGYKAEY